MFSRFLQGRPWAAALLASVSAALCLSGRAQADADIRKDAVVRAVAQVIPSVVNVATESVVESDDPLDEIFRQFYHIPPRTEARSSIGSGVIITEDGYLLTNLHVVNHATRIQVKLSDEAGGGVYDVEPVYTGVTHSDVAVLKIIPHQPGEKFKAAHFARDDDLLLGETVIALGDPFGLGVSVTRGILSSKRRATPKENADLTRDNWLQTDALINPGNSGGPLINLKGDLIGIDVAIMPGAQGIGFAIPVKEVRQALEDIFIPETAARWFGAKIKRGGAPATDAAQPGALEAGGDFAAEPGPLTVDAVEPGGPADQCGLKAGDQIVALDGRDPGDLVAFHRALHDRPAMNFQLTVRRGSEKLDLTLRLMTFSDLFHRRLGAEVMEVTPAIGARLGVSGGLVIKSVDEGGPAAQAGLRKNFVINGIDGQAIGDYYHAFLALDPLRPGNVAQLSALVPQTRGDIILGYRQAFADLKLR